METPEIQVEQIATKPHSKNLYLSDLNYLDFHLINKFTPAHCTRIEMTQLNIPLLKEALAKVRLDKHFLLIIIPQNLTFDKIINYPVIKKKVRDLLIKGLQIFVMPFGKDVNLLSLKSELIEIKLDFLDKFINDPRKNSSIVCDYDYSHSIQSIMSNLVSEQEPY